MFKNPAATFGDAVDAVVEQAPHIGKEAAVGAITAASGPFKDAVDVYKAAARARKVVASSHP